MNLFLLHTSIFLAFASAAPAGCKKSAEPRGPATKPATVEMRVGRETFNLEIADTEPERQRGLMNRDFLPPDHGMLFVFQEEEELSFWMKNTTIPLDIIYLDRNGKVVSIKQMNPRSLRGVPSDRPAMYAVELNQGAAAQAGVRVGDKLTIPPIPEEDATPGSAPR